MTTCRCRKHSLLAAILLALPLSLAAQSSSPETGYDFSGRLSVGADWKIVKKLHLSAEYSIWSGDMFSQVDRHEVQMGVKWSPLKYLSVGGGYSFIAHFNGSNEYQPRHRAYLDIVGSYSFGAWKLSLKENLRLTHKSYDINRYQQTPNLLDLVSRLKLTYKGFSRVNPYAFFELENCFNNPSFTYEYNQESGKYTNYEFLGYSDAYVSRIRLALGAEWKITRHHSIDFRFQNDWCTRKKIDTNAEGTKLKSWYWKRKFVNSLCISYVFSF